MLKASIIKGQNQNIDSSLSAFVKEWKGTPYVLGGITKRGIDCSGLNKRLYQSVYNITIPGVCYKQWEATSRVNRDSLLPGDLIFFTSNRSPSGWHCACYLGDSMFLHAPQKGVGVKISSLNEEKYSKRYKGAGRIIN